MLRPLLAVLVLAACSPNGGPDGGAGPGGVDGGPGGVDGGAPIHDAGSYPAPRTDATAAVGTATHLDVGAWNIENFPAVAATPSLAADCIASMNLDLIGLEEIADIDAFEELDARLTDYDSVLSTDTYGDGTYQKIAMLYRPSVLTYIDHQLILTGNGFELPRPPLQVKFAYDDGDGNVVTFIAIGLHFKAGRAAEDFDRRHDAFVLLEAHVRGLVDSGEENVIIFGDFNEHFDSQGTDNWAPFDGDAARYTVQTHALDVANEFTFIPGEVMLDHIVTTTGLDSAVGSSAAKAIHLEDDVSTYTTRLSDHRPITLSFGGT